MLRFTLTLLLILASSMSFSFGSKGHQVIGYIAQQHLTPSAQAAVLDMLNGESLASASTWADRMRSSRDNPVFWSYDYAANWHFVNIAADKYNYQASSKSPQGDAYVALLSFIEILADQTVTNPAIKEGLTLYFDDLDARSNITQQKQLALKFLIHLVGDLHQPLHVGYLEDRGGNNIKVKWFSKSTNLHSVWDSQLIEFSKLSSRQLSRKLIEQINTMPASSSIKIAEQKPAQWIEEALQLRIEVYASATDQSDFAQAYASHFIPTVEQQLLKAGLRLAHLLNMAFSETSN